MIIYRAALTHNPIKITRILSCMVLHSGKGLYRPGMCLCNLNPYLKYKGSASGVVKLGLGLNTDVVRTHTRP